MPHENHPTGQHVADGRRVPEFFREVNNEIVRLTQASGSADGHVTVLCECGDPHCVSQLHLTAAAYEEARGIAGRSFLKAGHEADGAHIAFVADGYVVADA